jgi:hypothetical protein
MGGLAPIDSQVIVVNEHTPIRQGKTEGYHSVYGALGLFPQPHRKGRSASGPIDLFFYSSYLLFDHETIILDHIKILPEEQIL